MIDLLQSLIDYIIRNNLAVKKDVDIFKDYSPPQDNAIVLFEYEGSSLAPFTTTSVRSVQVVVKNTDITVAKKLCWDIYKIFTNDTLIFDIGQKVIISPRNTPIKIDYNRIAFNMAVTVENF